MQHRHTPPPTPQPTAFAQWRTSHPNLNLILTVLILLGFARAGVAAMPLLIGLGEDLPGDLLEPFLAGVRLLEQSLSFLTAILWLALLIVVPYAGWRARRVARTAGARPVDPHTAPAENVSN